MSHTLIPRDIRLFFDRTHYVSARSVAIQAVVVKLFDVGRQKWKSRLRRRNIVALLFAPLLSVRLFAAAAEDFSLIEAAKNRDILRDLSINELPLDAH
jgi:hypothetical protein